MVLYTIMLDFLSQNSNFRKWGHSRKILLEFFVSLALPLRGFVNVFCI